MSSTLELIWTLPFLAMLASIAVLPLGAHRFWHAHYDKVATALATITMVALASTGQSPLILETFLHDYLPFIIMIGALYTIAGGINITVQARPTPAMNTAFLTLGTALAGWIGTTGASMLLIRPLLQMNASRKTRIHQVVFFIFLVSNIGGALTPLGDPPLFIGFLNGVDFFWTTQHLAMDMVCVIAPLLVLFWIIDMLLTRKETFVATPFKVHLKGGLNLLLFAGVLGMMFTPYPFREGGLVALAALSYFLTPRAIHTANHFSWAPFREVAVLFFGIFITVIPMISILKAGPTGPLAPLLAMVEHNNVLYFWCAGSLSAFLDNAPTYLVFFHMAGGDAEVLMHHIPRTLAAISLGSVFMGAMTYIGNAPNFMVKTIADHARVPMPHFFGYLLWSCGILVPLFLWLTWMRL